MSVRVVTAPVDLLGPVPEAAPVEDKRRAAPLARALAGGGTEESRKRRRDGDFFPTPPEVVLALLRAEPRLARAVVWEPHAGEGHLARALEAAGSRVIATEKADRGYGETGVDFLTAPCRLPPGPATFAEPKAIVMNPPFRSVLPHVHRALSHLGAASFVACLLPGEFWARKKHLALFAERPPCEVVPCAWKPDFTGAGSGIFTVQWCVWNLGGGVGGARFRPLPRPDMRDLPEAML